MATNVNLMLKTRGAAALLLGLVMLGRSGSLLAQ